MTNRRESTDKSAYYPVTLQADIIQETGGKVKGAVTSLCIMLILNLCIVMILDTFCKMPQSDTAQMPALMGILPPEASFYKDAFSYGV